ALLMEILRIPEITHHPGCRCNMTEPVQNWGTAVPDDLIASVMKFLQFVEKSLPHRSEGGYDYQIANDKQQIRKNSPFLRECVPLLNFLLQKKAPVKAKIRIKEQEAKFQKLLDARLEDERAAFVALQLLVGLYTLGAIGHLILSRGGAEVK